jgi:RNA polymerase-binding transcription factor DksA
VTPAPDSADLRQQLADQRASALGQIEALTRDLDGIFAAAESVATDDEHDPEGTTIAFERAQLTSLIEAAQIRVTELEHAAARLDAGDYGRCENCGGPIGAERLDARPAATTCISCASARR